MDYAGFSGGRQGSAHGDEAKRALDARFLANELTVVFASVAADDLAFTTSRGFALRLSNWRRKVFKPACAVAGIGNQFRIHDLRHTAASLMIQAGYPPKMLQEIMGHASITTTLDLYGHLYPGDMDRYADRLGEAAETTDPARIRPYGRPGSADDEASEP